MIYIGINMQLPGQCMQGGVGWGWVGNVEYHRLSNATVFRYMENTLECFLKNWKFLEIVEKMQLLICWEMHLQ